MKIIFICTLLLFQNLAQDLLPLPYRPLPTGEILPSGWLLQELNDEANGLAGFLADFWPSISESTWIGGNVNDPGGLNERVPYWLNGAVPLAKMTGNIHLTQQVKKYLDYIISHQNSDGWLGKDCCEPWPRFPLLLAMTQYAEGFSEDTRTIPAIRKFLHRLASEIDPHPLQSWAQYRWQDLVLTIWWMYDYYPNGEQKFLLEFARTVQSQGFDWSKFVNGPDFPKTPCTGSCCSLATHGVNVGQAIKDTGVWYRYAKNPAQIENTKKRIETIDMYHGQSSGIFSCSEHLAGLDPSQGAETCTVVETMFSFEILFSVFGNLSFSDRFELLAYNALPAAQTPDQWAHVYLQQGNQINAMHCDPHVYVSDGPDSNIYGLEPNYGCCTANFPQGWPKFVANLFMKTLDGGIAAVAYGPSEVHTTLNGKKVDILLTTDYPFGQNLKFSVNSETAFPFHLKIPFWAVNATVQIATKIVSVPSGQFYIFNCPQGTSTINLSLPSNFRTTSRSNGAVSIFKGPLLYALKIDTKKTELRHYSFQSSDWQFMPLTPWNYGIQLNSLNFVQGTVGKLPFSPENSPVKIEAKGKIIPQWTEAMNAANPPPMSPVSSSSPLQDIVLIPFGATNLRIVEFPYLQ